MTPSNGANRGKSLDPRVAQELLTRSFDAEAASAPRPTILVAGYTGSGKTSLIQAICGRNVVPDDRIGAGLPKTKHFDFYEDVRIRFWDSKGLEPGHSEESEFFAGAREHIRKLQESSNVDDHIHLVWYAIQGPGARVTSCDIRILKELFCDLVVVVVVTKADITRPNQLAAMTDVLRSNGTAADRIVAVSDHDETSLKKLVDVSIRLLPEARRKAFVAAQIVNIEEKRSRGLAIVHAAALTAAGAGAVPIPVSDAALITPIQIGMIASLAYAYGEPREALQAACGPVIAEIIGVLTASSLLKLIPGLGSAINASVAGALTEALGQLTLHHIEACALARAKGGPRPQFVLSFPALLSAIERLRRSKS